MSRTLELPPTHHGQSQRDEKEGVFQQKPRTRESRKAAKEEISD
jgi:hypothetical protein